MLKVKNLLERLDVFSLGVEQSEKAGEVSALLLSRGESVDFRDAMIAAVAMSNGLTLISRNTDRFSRFRGLKIDSW